MGRNADLVLRLRGEILPLMRRESDVGNIRTRRRSLVEQPNSRKTRWVGAQLWSALVGTMERAPGEVFSGATAKYYRQGKEQSKGGAGRGNADKRNG